MINKLLLENFKGLTGSYELGAITLLVGSNARGKSAIMQAATVALLGYVPALGKRNSDVFALASGPTMAVTAFHADAVEAFVWKQTGDKVSAKLPQQFSPMPAVMLDIQDFLGRSEAERSRILFERGGEAISDFNVDVLAAALIRIENSGRFTLQINATLNEVRKQIAAQTPIPVWLAQQIESAADALKIAKRDAAEKAAALRDARAREAATPIPEREMSGDEYALVAKHASDAAAKLRLAMSELEKAKTAAAAAAANQSKLEQLEQDRSSESLEQAIAELTAEAESLKGKIEIPADSQTQVNALRKSVAEQCDYIAGGEGKLKALREEISRLEAEAKRVIAGDCCPTCCATNSEWRKGVQLFTVGRVTAIEGTIASLMDLQRVRKTNLAETERLLASLDAAMNERAQLVQHHQLALTELADLKLRLMTRERLREQLKAVDTKPAEEAHFAAVEAEAKADAAHREARTRREATVAYRKAKAEAAELQAAAETLEQERAFIAQVVDCLRALQSELTERAIGALLTDANKLLEGVMEFRLEYKAGEFGYTRKDGRWVSARTFSGSEEMIAFAGLQMALCVRCPRRIMLLDEIGRIDSVRQTHLLNRIGELIQEGYLHQFIASDVRVPGYDSAHRNAHLVKVINL